jgi:DNA polymerase-3 subunit beta
MKITFIKSDVLECLEKVNSAVSTKNTNIPALEGVLITAKDKTLTLTGFDLEIGIKAVIKDDIFVQEEGAVVIAAKLFADILKKSNDERVTLQDEDTTVLIQSGRGKFKLPFIEAKDYPDVPSFDETNSVELPAETLRSMISQTIYAVSDDNNKAIYTGSLFKFVDSELTVVAIDGFRMAVRKEGLPESANFEIVIPKKAQLNLLKIIGKFDSKKKDVKVKIISGKKHVAFRVENYTIITRHLEGTFLDYEATIPKEYKTSAVVEVVKIKDSVERMSLLSQSDKVKSPVKCQFSADKIDFTCSSTMGKADDTLEVTVTGEDTEIGFNNKYLIDALKYVESDEVKLTLNGSLAPMIIGPKDGDSFLNMVVPMRLS